MTHAEDESEKGIEVPYAALRSETLRAVVEEFVTRDTTDYGERQRSLDEKVADVMRQLQRGEVCVVYEATTGTVNIVVSRRR